MNGVKFEIFTSLFLMEHGWNRWNGFSL